jgi:DUF4097 and DUF4098 domain-containing protein YvlB
VVNQAYFRTVRSIPSARPIGRRASLALLVGAGLALPGCVAPLHEQQVTFQAPHVSGAAVDVTARNGAITVKSGDVSEVAIVATLRMTTQARLGQAAVTATRGQDEALVIRAEPPPGGWRSREGVSFAITVPEASGVRASSGNGRITISGLAGEADLQTSNGGVQVVNHDGPVKVRTSNGAVELTNIAGPVNATSSNGAIRVALSGDNAGPARLRTSNGAVSLEVGPGFAGDLEIRTSNGSISVPDKRTTPGSYELLSAKRRSAAVRFGGGEGAESEIRTSNGSVKVALKK